MVIENGERMTAATSRKGKMAFEVHLPKIVGMRMFKANESFVFEAFKGMDEAVAFENSGNGAWMRDRMATRVDETLSDFTATPTAEDAELKDLLLDGRI